MITLISLKHDEKGIRGHKRVLYHSFEVSLEHKFYTFGFVKI